MPYCPNCLTEYVEGATECRDCGARLLPGSPPSAESNAGLLDDSPGVRLVRQRVFSGPTAQLDARLARNLLATQGIPCVLAGEVASGTLPGVDVVQLLVRRDDADQAAEILTGYLDLPGEVSPD